MAAGWLGSLRYVPERGPQLAMWYGILDRWPAGEPFVQKHGPRCPMWYGFSDKAARGRGRLSADTDHCRCRSMWYGCGDKRRRLEPLVCPQPRTTARRGACGTCLRTNPLARDPVCPKTRTSLPHVVRVSGQMARGRNVCPKTRTKVPHVVRVPGQMACGRPVCPQTRTSMPETCHGDRPSVPKRATRTVPPSQTQRGCSLSSQPNIRQRISCWMLRVLFRFNE